MPSEREISFAQSVINHPPSQVIENVASLSQETNRIPDTYIYFFRDKKFITPNGELVENYIDKKTYLGQVEFNAFLKTQKWLSDNDGYALWFSPPYPNVYPVSKIIIQQSLYVNEVKTVINRAVVLDEDGDKLIEIANLLLGQNYQTFTQLRSNPVFPTEEEFDQWFKKLSFYTSQTSKISEGVDLTSKTEKYASIAEIKNSIRVHGEDRLFNTLYKQAQSQGFIGNLPDSCPILLKTAFSAVVDNSLIIYSDESKYVKNCGNCGIAIEASITKGYRCKSCGGEYKGC